MIIKLEPYKKQKTKIKSVIERAINDLDMMAATWRANNLETTATTWRVRIQLDRPEEAVYELIEPDIQEIA